ncbi:MAG: proton-conducting transporter membrane subunit [Candidatus Omnitrophota bacterium]
MTGLALFLPILIPLTFGVFILLIKDRYARFREFEAILATALNLLAATALFKANLSYVHPMALGFEFSLRLYHFSAFIMLFAAGFAFLVTLYSTVFTRGKAYAGQFFAYLLISLSFINGAVLADNLLVLLFFWEGLLVTLFGMIAIGNKNAFKTATKAFIIVGISDLCMMLGIILTGHLAGTLTISRINLPIGALGGVAFILLMIGAISKAGSMPFHSWIPDAAEDAPLPFMAFFPGAIEKLVGIYFLTRISIDMFQLTPHSWISYTMMTVGALTILLAVMMALIQKDFKRLLSYHAISQVGYMVLGIGTAVPIGIVGGLFHMVNNALYKSCLFFTGGAVEHRTGTTDLRKLGGLGVQMPVTFACFIIAALSISGVPPFNGFFSKELVYDGALERGVIFYLAAVLGSFFTAASFLKLGHAAFLGKADPARKDVREVGPAMLLPMVVIAGICVLFGVANALPIRAFIQPVLGERLLEGHDFAGMPANIWLVIGTVVVLAAALANHLWGVRKYGSGIKAVDHIHHAPVLSGIYDRAEKRFFDPYTIGLAIVALVARVSWWCDRGIDFIYDVASVKAVTAATERIKKAHTGNYSLYLGWSLAGAAIIGIFLLVAK